MILLKANYNAWFYNQHKYRTSKRNNVESFTDTKWYNMNDRFRKLIDMASELITDQPSLVQANNKGFDMLLDLMGRSNYTFEDLNDSLKEAYRTSLQQAMSYNMVNTHAIMFHTDTNDRQNVIAEKFTHYKIIDAPFDQLHFGHRDEFIRQKLHEMHITENDYYIDIDKFNSPEISDVLDFCILCTVNGYISNDCKVAVDDHGFKFKVGWKSNDPAEFIIYKLDKCRVHKVIVKARNDMSFIPYSELSGINKNEVNGLKCMINLYNEKYKDSLNTVPNFGFFDENGLNIKGVQNATMAMVNNVNLIDVNMTIYTLKYFHEVPNIFPAVNYYDIMENKLVYDERYEKLRTPDGSLVVESTYSESNDLETCTPPITIDRDTSYTFDTIVKCLSLKTVLMNFKSTIIEIGNFFRSAGDMNYYNNTLKPKVYELYSGLSEALYSYKAGAVITSLVSSENVNLFDKLFYNVRNIYFNFNTFNTAQNFVFDELYGNNYDTLVEKLCKPFMNDKLQQFRRAINIPSNFYNRESPTRFNRPISEQCFITLKYSEEAQSWLFAYPIINHFHGIGNTFYINEGLTGTEIFKFFVLYTDTMDPYNENIEHFDLNTVIDFDLFYDEMEKYYGCIRYWDAESRLAKISKMLYRKYDDETCIHVLSKMLKRKIEGKSIIEVYPSDINYEESNITSDNVEDYDEDTYRGPFSVNFLFYTLLLLNNNVDKLQAYFYRNLTHNKFSNRYADIDISSFIKDNQKYPISFSQFTISPIRFPDGMIKPLDASCLVYYGLPLITNDQGVTNLYDPYRFVLNVYDPETKFPLVTVDGLDEQYYVQYSDITEYSGRVVSYNDTIEFGRLVSTYLDALYDGISEIQTNYQKPFDVTPYIDRLIDTLDNIKNDMMVLINRNNIATITKGSVTTQTIINMITSDAIKTELLRMRLQCAAVAGINYNTSHEIITFINREIILTLKYIYRNYGFDDNVKHRVVALYKHLRKINKAMNPYVFKKWLFDIDLHILATLDQHVAFNENYRYASNTFYTMYDRLEAFIVNDRVLINQLDEMIKDLTGTFKTTFINPLIVFCQAVITDVIFDIYTYSSIDINFGSTSYNSRPAYIVIPMPDDTHTNPPFGNVISGNRNLIFKANSHKEGNNYKIDSMSSICEYVFFDGSPLTNIIVTVLDENAQVLGSISNVSLNFIRDGSTADRDNGYNYLPNTDTTVIDIENHHESFEVNGTTGVVVNEKCADMNYELLVGNNFSQLEHVSELIMNPITWNPGSIDRLTIENQTINRLMILNHGHDKCASVHFKPCQVIHPEESINGKYFEGERVYVKTLDTDYIFPIKITSVDHTRNKGFMEAEVDQWNSTWLKIDDPTLMDTYFNNTIECEVIDDSIRNFLDEYSDGTLKTFYAAGYDDSIHVMDDKHESCYVLPGDPIYVTSNAPFVYTRLQWMFNEDVPNRFIDEEHKQYRFIFVGEGFINDNDVIKINMINHNFNNLSTPEIYPILKDSPNDHSVRRKEIETFKKYINDNQLRIRSLENEIQYLEGSAEHTSDYYQKKKIYGRIDDDRLKQNMCRNRISMLEGLIEQPEPKATWFNVLSNDAAMIYIENGRAEKFSPIFKNNIRDLCYDDNLDVFIYDWENKHWVDPSTYSISYEIEDGLKIDERDDYTTDNVMTTLTITPTNEFVNSNKLMIYFGYDQSDIFDDIEMNSKRIQVQFKPILIIDKPDENNDPYYDIRIRKHFDGFEKYLTTSNDDGEIIVKRIRRSGKYTDSPVFRFIDLKLDINGTESDYTSISTLKVKSPFEGFSTNSKLHDLQYSVTINAPIDSFVEDQHIKLICISNNDKSSYDGNISTVIFEGVTSLDGANQVVTITNSSLSNYGEGTFICTVFKDDGYDPVGGVVTITVTSTERDIYGDWVTVPTEYMLYHELPEEFMIIPETPSPNTDATVILENHYIKNYDDTIYEDNHGLYNPYEYYYDTSNQKRVPISDVRTNNHNRRMVIDTTTNPDIHVVKSPYIGICRYSLMNIPENGLIDMTGYLPTPLTRKRYEFWVNGRFVSNPKDLIILSPTSIQLCNMKSLRNFECIELVDDVIMDTDIMHQGSVYIDINGNTYSNYKLALLSNSKINKQNLMFIFNANNHTPMNDYTKSIVDNPNNRNSEADILSTITFDDSSTDYNRLSNIPSINGTSLFHPKLSNLGMSELDNMKIIKAFDKVWKHEAATDPLFMNTHRCDSKIVDNNAGLIIHIQKLTVPDWHDLDIDTTGMYVVHVTGPVEKYFSLYVSTDEDGVIDDVNKTKKIIPFMSSSVYILLDNSYAGMWLHSTYPNTNPVHII